MSPRTAMQQVDLARLFNAVTSTLQENQQSLNAADDYNHNHGDNMVDSFRTITKAVRAKKGQPPSEQLAYASDVLSHRSQSGSAQLYSQGLANAADRLKDKPAITQEDAMLLVQSLLGGHTTEPQGQASGMDLLTGLLGGQADSQQSQPAKGDPFGGLLGTLMGGAPAESSRQTTASPAGGSIDLNTLLNAGMAFFQARQRGAEPMEALVQAVLSGSQMQASAHRSQSGQLVAESLLTTLGTMLAGRKSR